MNIEEMISAYIDCALWCGVCGLDPDANDNEYDHDASELAPETLATMRSDCEDFASDPDTLALIEKSGMTADQCGHDFWLTRNGHGAGFWDRGYSDGIGEALTARAETYKTCDLILGDDGLIYC